MAKTNKTPGERWSEEIENENPVAAFAVFLAGMLAVTLALAAFTAVPQAEGEYEAAKVTVSKKAPEKKKVRAFKKAAKEYRKWKANMTKKQRTDYRDAAWAMLDAKKASKLKKLEKKCDAFVKRAKLCQHVNARNWNDKKVAYVSHWGARVNRYLHGSPMGGTGYSIAKHAKETNMDPRLYPAIACIESGLGRHPYGSRYNVCGWVCCTPVMHSWDDGIGKWHRYFRVYFSGERYPISSMHGYGGYGPEQVNAEMAKI